MDLSGFLADAGLFLRENVSHYSRAVFGFRLRLDPDTRDVTRFFPSILKDSVLEYRTYGGMILPALGFAWGFTRWPALGLPVFLFWIIRSIHRATFYQSPFAFWEQAWQESPQKLRVNLRYFEELSREIERRMKQGLPTRALERRAFQVQARVIQLSSGGRPIPPLRPRGLR